MQLLELDVALEDKSKGVEQLQEKKGRMKAEKRQIEAQRQKKESELKVQHKKLHEVYEQDYAQSFEEDHCVDVEDIEERHEWRDGDTDYEESCSVRD